jgi:glycolate oxidase FAD binding subunit
VRQLHADGVPWLPAGLGRHLHWGPAVQGGTTTVSSRRLGGILEHSPGDFTVTVAAGTPWEELRLALEPERQWLALDPPWGGRSGSVGGVVARGLAGGYAHRHLGVRDQLIGIEMLRADGVRARAGGRVVKNVAGYDLMRLLSGSWGSLGLITAITLRTQPLPRCRRGLWLQGDLAGLAELSRWLLSSSLSPERVDWWSAPLAASAGDEPRPGLLLGLASVDQATLEEQIACIRERTTLPGRVLEPAELERRLALGRGGGDGTAAADHAAGWLLRPAVDPDAVERFLALPELAGLALEMGAGTGLGLAWCPAGAPPPEPERVLALRRHCCSLGGYLSVLIQPPAAVPLPAWEDAPARPLIETVKRLFDPKQQLAPGRLPGVAAPLQAASTR